MDDVDEVGGIAMDLVGHRRTSVAARSGSANFRFAGARVLRARLCNPETRRLQAVDDGEAIAIEPKALAALERDVAMITVLGNPQHPAQAFDQGAGAILDPVN